LLLFDDSTLVGAAAVGAGAVAAGAGVSTTAGVAGACWHPVAARPKATMAEAEMHF
jgi:hypothetical protein